eukprot:3812170-Amphidinium_carterae.1
MAAAAREHETTADVEPKYQESEDVVLATAPPIPSATYYPDGVGMKSRPYETSEGRPYPHLEEEKVVYHSEKNQGTYPSSSVPRFSDVTVSVGFSKEKEALAVHREALTSKEIRRWEERRAFFEGTEHPDPDVYKWDRKYADMKDLRVTTPFSEKEICSLARWQMGCYAQLRDKCYAEYLYIPEDLRYWCYACRKRPSRDVTLAKCAACDNVYMCMDHRIFPDCLHNFYYNPIPICCRHS